MNENNSIQTITYISKSKQDHRGKVIYKRRKARRKVKMLTLTTPSFPDGGYIPDCNSGFGEDKSPLFLIETKLWSLL